MSDVEPGREPAVRLRAPHLATLAPATGADGALEPFIRAVARGFHDDLDDAVLALASRTLEPGRCAGVRADGRWVATCCAYTRRLGVPGGQVRAAAVSAVTVAPAFRRRGLLRAMMQEQLAGIAARGEEPVAALWASESAIYGRFGYGSAVPQLRLSGPTRPAAFRPGVELGPGSVGEVEVADYRAAVVGLRERLADERPGRLDRPPVWWERVLDDHERVRGGGRARRYALAYDADGAVTGYLAFRLSRADLEPGEVRVEELEATGPAALARLWRFVLDFDLVDRFRATVAVDCPLLHLLADPRAVTATGEDSLHVRLVDVAAALAARAYAAPADLVLAVDDPLLPANHGRFRLTVRDGRAEVRAVEDEPDVALAVRDLGALYLGGVPASTLHRAGLMTERRPGAVATLTATMGWSRAPFCDDHF